MQLQFPLVHLLRLVLHRQDATSGGVRAATPSPVQSGVLTNTLDLKCYPRMPANQIERSIFLLPPP
jgi:hypothetical protein